MTTVIQSSPVRAAAYYIPELILGGAFPLLYVLAIGPADHLPVWLKAFFGLAALAGLGLFLRAVFRIYRVLSAKGVWKVSIAHDRLHWETALPNKHFPLDVALRDIAEAVQLQTFGKGTDGDTWIETTFELRFTDGSVRAFSQEDCGVNPHRVFLALKDHGIVYRLWKLDKTEDRSNEKRTIEQTY